MLTVTAVAALALSRDEKAYSASLGRSGEIRGGARKDERTRTERARTG